MQTIFITSILIICLQFLGGHIVTGKIPRIRGVPIAKNSLYAPDKDFVCLDGSKTIPFTSVNDDYCDCTDGSDEPGTSACPKGVFYCQNLGYQALYIPSSWVNDGVCDCCDASDEYSSDVRCIDNCNELGQAAYLEAQKAAELARQGHKIRLEMINRGKQIKSENQARLSKLRNDHAEAELIKKEREAIKLKAEERESAALEKYKPPEPQQPETTADEEKELSDIEAEEYFKMLDSDSSGTLTINEIQTRATFDKDRNGEVSREEALFFLNNQEEINLKDFTEVAWHYAKAYLLMEKGLFKPGEDVKKEEEQIETNHNNEQEFPNDETHDSEDIVTGEEEQAEENLEEEHSNEENQPSDESNINKQETEAGSAVQYDEETQALVDEANQAREKYQESEKNVLDLLNEIRNLETKVERDYGPEEEFAALDSECFEYTDQEYVYTLCLFDKSVQRSKSGGSEVNLGIWNEWINNENNKYTKMKYDRGLSCWNGPNRSVTVTLKCGTENKILLVTEPNRCEYAMEFSTPAVCNVNVENVDNMHDEL